MLGRGNRWWLSGKDWCAWNAVFGPRGTDGLPKPLWDPKTGAIDRSVAEHWQQYDLRLVLTRNWRAWAEAEGQDAHLRRRRGRLFPEQRRALLDAELKKVDPPFDGHIQFGPMAGHGYHPVDEFAEILARYEATRPK